MYQCMLHIFVDYAIGFCRISAMYIEAVPNRSSPPAILLRESYREGDKVKKRTLANLSDWPTELVEGLRTLLKGGKAIAADTDPVTILRSLPHGHIAAAPWASSATAGTARRGSCRSSMACSAPPTAARWRWRCSKAPPAIRPRSPLRSPRSNTASA